MLPDPTSAQSIGWLILSCFALAGGLNQLHALARRVSGREEEHHIKPNPLVVRAEDQWVPRHQFDAHVAETRRTTEHIMAKIDSIEQNMKEELDQKIAAVHEKCNEMAIQLSAVGREVEMSSAQLNVVASDIKQLLSRP